MRTVVNPTSRDKAVRANGGLVTIRRGQTVGMDVVWSRDEIARYEAAGLVISDAPVAGVETFDDLDALRELAEGDGRRRDVQDARARLAEIEGE